MYCASKQSKKEENFLASGSSDYSFELLKKAGGDMASPEPVRQALGLFESHLAQREGLIG